MPDDEVQLPDVSKTAVGIAAIRAWETARPDRLFADPLAERFVAASGRSLEAFQTEAVADERTRRYGAAIQQWAVVRTRFLDDFVTATCRDGCGQVVLVGAGLDARAFRLAVPTGTRWFEMDLPEVLAFKQQVLDSAGAEPQCERIVAAVDLRDDWPAALTAAGLQSDVPTAWIAEGLLAYLTADENETLLGRISALSPPGSRLALTLRSPDRDGDASRWRPAVLRALWRSDGVDDPATWLRGLGWDAQVFDAAERAAVYGRPAASGDAPPRRGGRLVSATRT